MTGLFLVRNMKIKTTEDGLVISADKNGKKIDLDKYAEKRNRLYKNQISDVLNAKIHKVDK